MARQEKVRGLVTNHKRKGVPAVIVTIGRKRSEPPRDYPRGVVLRDLETDFDMPDGTRVTRRLNRVKINGYPYETRGGEWKVPAIAVNDRGRPVNPWAEAVFDD